jgi:hypothetical protein
MWKHEEKGEEESLKKKAGTKCEEDGKLLARKGEEYSQSQSVSHQSSWAASDVRLKETGV